VSEGEVIAIAVLKKRFECFYGIRVESWRNADVNFRRVRHEVMPPAKISKPSSHLAEKTPFQRSNIYCC
jgi:hypothetical protein